MMYWHGITKITIKIIKSNKSNNVIINQTVPRKMSEYFCSKLIYHVILTNISSFVIWMHFFLLKVTKHCQNLLYDHPNDQNSRFLESFI